MIGGDAKSNDVLWGVLAAMVVCGGILRIMAAGGDLWFDEIWSLDHLAMALASDDWHDRAALLFHDNTHLLNTLWLYLLGPDASPMAYRSLAVFSGTLGIVLGFLVGRRRSVAEGLLFALLLALSYPLVHYGSEARGYAPMMAAALAALWIAELWLEKPTAGRAAAFVAVSFIGITAHLTFFVVQAAVGFHILWALFRTNGSVVSIGANLVILFGVQIVYLTVFAVLAWDNMVIGGGAFVPPAVAVPGLLMPLLGIDAVGTVDPASVQGILLAVSFAVALFAVVFIPQSDDQIVLAVAVFVFPLAFVVFQPAAVSTPRYFLAAAPFVLLSATRGLMWLLAGEKRSRLMGRLLVVAFILGQIMMISEFLKAGRGDFNAAFQQMAGEYEGEATVTAVHERSVDVHLGWWQRRGGRGGLRFVEKANESDPPATWFVVNGGHGADNGRYLDRAVGSGSPVRYEQFGLYEHWGFSGDTWIVYRRLE